MTDFDPARFQLSPGDGARLDDLYEMFAAETQRHLGNPGNFLYDYRDLHRFFAFTINNVGDPFVDGWYKINTHSFEREVVAFFAQLYHAPQDEYWGHITHGGTEGNMYGLYLAREVVPEGHVYFSRDAHYSIPKAMRLMGLPNTPIDTQTNGEMDYDILEREIITDGKPPIIVATIGTTMRGAIDRPEKILDILDRNGIHKYYIHCDAALGGMILPFLADAPVFDFRLPINSISVSGHKMVGSPVPCGVVIARKRDVAHVQNHIEVIGAPDTTLSGSRNGHTALFLWYAVRRFGVDGFRAMIARCFEVKRHALEQLDAIGWPAHANDFSVIIVIKRPPEAIVRKWQLAVEGDTAHLVIMPNVTTEHIDAFVEDVKSELLDREGGES